MKLEDFGEASTLVTELGTLEHHIREVEKVHSTFMGVTLGGTYQRDELTDVVRPVVLKHLNSKRDAVLAKLAQIGIRQK